jgi:putative methyltransferase (TIGR04325 family)
MNTAGKPISSSLPIANPGPKAPSPLKRARIWQIRLLTSALCWAGTKPAGRRIISRLRSAPGAGALLSALVGYRRTFPTFSQAQICASLYIVDGHEHPDDIRFHASIAGTVRESDYPVLFHLATVASNIHRVFDLGGNVGNLLYAYSPHLQFPADLIWTVYDLPAKNLAVLQLASDRNDTRVRFTTDLRDAASCDLFIASGSLHYFEEPLSSLLSKVGRLPKHVIANRTPCLPNRSVISVQDNGSYLVPCKLHNRQALIQEMAALGYDLVAEWPVHERKLMIPLYPEASAPNYSGFYFVLRP